jgi:predicted regulator of Ras-like GTPase activity (Roadblock/LC7/MglB family)
MASALPEELEEDRLGAMSAALLSLGEQAALGLGRGELNQIFVEGEHGFVFLMSARDQAVLTAIATRTAKIGFMLFEMRRAADQIGAALEGVETPVIAPEAVAAAPRPAPPATAPAPAEAAPVLTEAAADLPPPPVEGVAAASVFPPPAAQHLAAEPEHEDASHGHVPDERALFEAHVNGLHHLSSLSATSE